MGSWWHRAWRAVGRFLAEQTELQERLALLNRPWEQRYLHWAGDGFDSRLHGEVPPPTGRRYGVTARGWCPCDSGPVRS